MAPILRMHHSTLSRYTVDSVRAIRDVLQIETPIVLASSLDVPSDNVGAVLAQYSTSILWTLPDSEVRDKEARSVLEWDQRAYVQNFRGFEPGMSTLDLIFNLGPKAVDHVRQYRVRGATGSQGLS